MCISRNKQYVYNSFKEIWNSYNGKKTSLDKDFNFFLKKTENISVDFNSLLIESKKNNKLYLQTWLNKVLHTKNNNNRKFDHSEFRQSLIEMGADEQHVDDWMTVRRKKGAVFT